MQSGRRILVAVSIGVMVLAAVPPSSAQTANCRVTPQAWECLTPAQREEIEAGREKSRAAAKAVEEEIAQQHRDREAARLKAQRETEARARAAKAKAEADRKAAEAKAEADRKAFEEVLKVAEDERVRQIMALDLTSKQKTSLVHRKPFIGAQADHILTGLGRPDTRRTTVTALGTTEVWTYRSGNMLVTMENDAVVSFSQWQ